MPDVSDWSLPGSQGHPLYGNTHLPVGEPRGILVICHGFKGYKDYGFLPRLADHAADAGLVVHRFNFSHSGVTPDFETFQHPELFEQDTWAKQVYDVGQVLKILTHPTGLPTVLFGHSRGGLTALLAAAHYPEQLVGVVTAASPASACSLDDDQRAMLRRAGRLASPSGRTGQTLYVGKAWLDEIEDHPERVDPVRAIEQINLPILLMHGRDDATVPVESAHRLHQANPDAQQVVLEDTNHVFNAPNPMPADSPPSPQTAQLFEHTTRFALTCCQAKPA